MSADPSFRMTVEDVFSIRNRGTVVTGKIESGTLKAGDEVYIQRSGATSSKTVVTAIEMFRKQLNEAGAGDNVGVLLRNIDKSGVQRGDVLMGSGYDFSWKP